MNRTIIKLLKKTNSVYVIIFDQTIKLIFLSENKSNKIINDKRCLFYLITAAHIVHLIPF